MKKPLSLLLVPMLAGVMASAQSRPTADQNNGAGTQTAQTDDTNRAGNQGGHNYSWIGLIGLLGLAGLGRRNSASASYDTNRSDTAIRNREEMRRAG